MMNFSPGELNDMREAQEAHMMDTCLIAEPAKTADSYNLPAESWDWTAAETSLCGFDSSPSQELLNQVPSSEAVLRLPIETILSNQARVRVTKRFDETQDTPMTYEVIGAPRSGPSGLLIWLKQVTDGSDD